MVSIRTAGIFLTMAVLLVACGGGGGGSSNFLPNEAPVARFTVFSQSFAVPATVAFNASGSSDADGSIASYQWDFGDGTTTTGQVVSHIYEAAGTFTVRLTVTDNDDASASREEVVTVVEAQPPVAVVTISPVNKVAGNIVRFDASESTDPDSDIAAFYWDFDDSGAFGQGAEVEYTFDAPGDYDVVLTITDSTGLQTIETHTITVLPRSAGQFSLGGTVRATGETYVDGDTNDPLSDLAPNNDTVQAQVIGNPSITGGFVTKDATGDTDNGDRFASSSDVSDYYRVELQANQKVLLEISDWGDGAADLDLYLYNEAGLEVGNSIGESDVEAVEALVPGVYFVEVYAYAGQSNYELSIGVSASAIPARAWSMGSRSPIIEDEVLLQLRGDAVLSPQARTDRTMALALEGEPAVGRLSRFRLASRPALRPLAAGFHYDDKTRGKLATLTAIKQLSRDPAVAQVAPNYRVTPQATVPTDPQYLQQWHYPKINLPQAWDYATGNGVIVAVLDTGVYLAHEDLAANLVNGYDFIRDPTNAADGNGIDNNPDDPGDGGIAGSSSWHGTHVAGTVAAVTNNGRGGVGVAYGAKIMPIRVLGTEGGSSYDIIQGLRYAARLPNDSGTLPPTAAKIANLSLGCQFCFSTSEQQQYQAVRDAGVIIVAAAGNENSTDPGYPASYAGVVSVSATNRLDQRAPYSNQSPNVDIAAPGGDQRTGASGGILSTLVDESSGARRSAYAWYQGTSMATPHVAGVAALMAELHPSLTPAEFDQAISSGEITVDIGAAGKDDSFGHGRVDAFKAVQYALALAGGTLPGAMSVNPSSVEFGTSGSTADVELEKVGSGPVSVVSVTDNADWLTVTATGVDGDGFGTYRLDVDRTGLVDGRYQATVTFTDDNDKTAQVSVGMSQGTQTATGGAGYIYILLLDENLNFFDQQHGAPDAQGEYPFLFEQIPAGDYYLVAGTDSDNDFEICDAGEVCGAYPTLGLLTPITINSSVTNADFLVLIGDAVSTNAASTQSTGKTPAGFKRSIAK